MIRSRGNIIDSMVRANFKCKEVKALNDSCIRARQTEVANGNLIMPPRKYLRIFKLNNLSGYINAR